MLQKAQNTERQLQGTRCMFGELNCNLGRDHYQKQPPAHQGQCPSWHQPRQDFKWPLVERCIWLPRCRALLTAELPLEDLAQQQHFRTPRHFRFLPPSVGRKHCLYARSRTSSHICKLEHTCMPRHRLLVKKLYLEPLPISLWILTP